MITQKRIHQANGEFQHQVALMDWAKLNEAKYPELKWLFAIPNGGHRSKAAAGKAKAEGVKAGVFDIALPVPRYHWTSLWIEMKYGDNKLTKEQKEFKEFIEGQGGLCIVCYDWQVAAKEIVEYLKAPKSVTEDYSKGRAASCL